MIQGLLRLVKVLLNPVCNLNADHHLGPFPTCHVLEGEGSGSVAPGVTLLVSYPRLVQILHEAILMRAEEKQQNRH